MTVREVKERVRAARDEWNTLIACVSERQMDEIVEEDGRRLKDVVAHVTWFEREMEELLRTRKLVGSKLWGLPPSERNAAIHEMNRDRAVEDILAEAATVHAELEVAVAGLVDDDLNNPARFENMPSDWVPWQIIAQNTWEHYEAHAEDIRRRLDLDGE